MILSFTIYYKAANSILLASAETSWSFGTVFSLLSESFLESLEETRTDRRGE
jgi:hypothetical protein